MQDLRNLSVVAQVVSDQLPPKAGMCINKYIFQGYLREIVLFKRASI